jgi:hypothetical protein
MRAAVPYGRHPKVVRQIVKIARTRIAERPLQISEFSRLLSIEHTAITLGVPCRSRLQPSGLLAQPASHSRSKKNFTGARGGHGEANCRTVRLH